jgi:hypothetical protein
MFEQRAAAATIPNRSQSGFLRARFSRIAKSAKNRSEPSGTFFSSRPQMTSLQRFTLHPMRRVSCHIYKEMVAGRFGSTQKYRQIIFTRECNFGLRDFAALEGSVEQTKIWSRFSRLYEIAALSSDRKSLYHKELQRDVKYLARNLQIYHAKDDAFVCDSKRNREWRRGGRGAGRKRRCGRPEWSPDLHNVCCDRQDCQKAGHSNTHC